MNTLAIYPGSFDPVTCGHMDIIDRALKVLPNLVVAVAVNIRKQPMFTPQERVEMLQQALADKDRVSVDSFSGLLVDYAQRRNADIIVRGLRALSDFENEFQMAHMNRRLAPGIETLFMMTGQEHFYVSSQTVKEVAYFGGDISGLVPDLVLRQLRSKNGQLGGSNG